MEEKKKRADPAETKRRLRVVEGLLHRCFTAATVQDRLSKEWGISQRTVRTYITKVYRRWEADARATRPERTEQRRQQFEGLLEYAMLQKPPDLKTACVALDRLCKIDGVYAAEKLELAGGLDINNINAMTSGEKRSELEQLFSMYATEAKGNGHSNGHANGKGNGSAPN